MAVIVSALSPWLRLLTFRFVSHATQDIGNPTRHAGIDRTQVINRPGSQSGASDNPTAAAAVVVGCCAAAAVVQAICRAVPVRAIVILPLKTNTHTHPLHTHQIGGCELLYVVLLLLEIFLGYGLDSIYRDSNVPGTAFDC